jgi:hypothetical protein
MEVFLLMSVDITAILADISYKDYSFDWGNSPAAGSYHAEWIIYDRKLP